MNIKIIKNIIIRTERRTFKNGTFEIKTNAKAKMSIAKKTM